jgi:hypothetical protein
MSRSTRPKITTVSAMRVRRAPQVAAEEVTRLKLGTVVSAVARSPGQDTVGGKTDYWYRVGLPKAVISTSVRFRKEERSGQSEI